MQVGVLALVIAIASWPSGAVLAVMVTICFVTFPLTWTGRLRNRYMLRLRENIALPAVIRNVGVLYPFAVIGLAPLLFAPSIAGMSDRMAGFVILGGSGALLAGVGALLVSYRPPRWLTPPWLRAEDEQFGRVLPEPGLFDRGVELVGVPFVLLGVGLALDALTVLVVGR